MQDHFCYCEEGLIEKVGCWSVGVVVLQERRRGRGGGGKREKQLTLQNSLRKVLVGGTSLK